MRFKQSWAPGDKINNIKIYEFSIFLLLYWNFIDLENSHYFTHPEILVCLFWIRFSTRFGIRQVSSEVELYKKFRIGRRKFYLLTPFKLLNLELLALGPGRNNPPPHTSHNSTSSHVSFIRNLCRIDERMNYNIIMAMSKKKSEHFKVN